MWTESEILELILGYAREDDRVRLVVMNGSRVNPSAPKDIFQDFDVVYYVTDIEPYLHKHSIIDHFGEPMIVQFPDEMGVPPATNPYRYAYLMQFMDGSRIDLTFSQLDKSEAIIGEDSLTVVLLDKDGRVPDLSPPDDRSYLPAPPTEKQFEDCCNEFWWLNPYVAKGLWRGELVGPKYYLDVLMREELMKMLAWFIGDRFDFQKGIGKHGRYLSELLPGDLWGMVKNTFSDDDTEGIWEALFVMGSLFHLIAETVAQRFGFHYPGDEEARVLAFVQKIRRLPGGAASFDL